MEICVESIMLKNAPEALMALEMIMSGEAILPKTVTTMSTEKKTLCSDQKKC